MEEKLCNRLDICSAPLCPLYLDNPNYSWFPDEEICRAKKFGNPQWLKNQKRIAKATNKFEDGYFTFEILKRNFKIQKGIKGLDPNSEIEKEVLAKDWFKKHPEKKKREISEEEKTKMRERLAFFRKRKKRGSELIF